MQCFATRLVLRIVNSTDTFKELAILYALCLLCAALIFAIVEDKSFGDSALGSANRDYGRLWRLCACHNGRPIAAVALMHLVPLFIIPLIIVRLLRTFVRDEHAFTHAEQEQIKSDLAAIKRALKIDQ